MTEDPALVVETIEGVVRGRLLPDGSRRFAGVPFAAPPIGELRLRPPRPHPGWRGVRDAAEFGPSASQRTSALLSASAGAARRGSGEADPFAGLPVPGATEPISEDCLSLSVWSPVGAQGLPVLVWLHGGGFDVGSGSPPVTDGAALARALGAVVVSVTYRLGALGFLHLADLGGSAWAGSTNLGFQDQAAALRWVRANIARFGGDPRAVTVAGQSAGAFSIGTLLAMPSAAGLVDRAILQSGSAARYVEATTATAIAEDLLAALRLDDVDALTTVDADRILAAQNGVVDSDVGTRFLPGGRTWGGVVDGHVLPRRPEEAVADGSAREVPLLVGANRDEVRLFALLGGDAFAPSSEAAQLAELRAAGAAEPEALLTAYRRRAGPDATPGDVRAAILSDAVYRRPVTRLAALQTAAGGVAHSYLFGDEPLGPGLGAFHGADLLHLFDALAPARADTPERVALRGAFLGAWSAFVATGEPGWPAHRSGTTRWFAGAGEWSLIDEPADDAVARAWR